MKSKIFKKAWQLTKKNPDIATLGVGTPILAYNSNQSLKRWKKMGKLSKKYGLELGKTPINKAEFKAFVNIHKELYGIK